MLWIKPCARSFPRWSWVSAQASGIFNSWDLERFADVSKDGFISRLFTKQAGVPGQTLMVCDACCDTYLVVSPCCVAARVQWCVGMRHLLGCQTSPTEMRRPWPGKPRGTPLTD